MRDLCRARTDAVPKAMSLSNRQDLRRGRAQLKALLLRNGYRCSGKSTWTEAHRRYLRELVLPHAAQRVVIEDAIASIASAGERIGRLEDQDGGFAGKLAHEALLAHPASHPSSLSDSTSWNSI